MGTITVKFYFKSGRTVTGVRETFGVGGSHLLDDVLAFQTDEAKRLNDSPVTGDRPDGSWSPSSWSIESASPDYLHPHAFRDLNEYSIYVKDERETRNVVR